MPTTDSTFSSFKDPPILHDLYVTLDEVFHGCTKKVKISRQRYSSDNQSLKIEEKILEIQVKKGWKSGTKITFPNEGDEGPGKLPADVIFIIKDSPHKHFQRDGSDLIYTCNIGIMEALMGHTVLIPTLTNGSIPLKVPDDLQHDTVCTRRLANGGLPYPKDPDKRGDLIIHFKIDTNLLHRDMPSTDNKSVVIKDPPILHDLYVTLDEVFHGCTKKVKISRQRYSSDNQSLKTEEKILEIQVKKGWKSGTKITFPNEGDEGPGKLPADVIFIIKDSPHKHFQRDGSNLTYTRKIGIMEAIVGHTIRIPTLTNGSIPLKVPDDFNQITVYRLANEGLPYPKDPDKRGDLIVYFKMDTNLLHGDMPTTDSSPPSIKDPPILHDLYVTLDEVFHGCTKKVKISRQRYSSDNQSLKTEEKILEIQVKKGWKSGTKITFANEGDEGPGKLPADVIFIIKDSPHKHFQRDGSDLIYTCKIGQSTATGGTIVQIPTLVSNSIPLRIPQNIKTDNFRIIANEGLPIPKDLSRRGDMRIYFEF